MKILQINAINELHSTGRSMYEMHKQLELLGHQSLLAYAEGPPCKGGYKIGSRLGHKCHALLSRITGKQGYFSAGSTKKLIQYISKTRPDVVHLRNLHGNFLHLHILLRFLGEQDIPTVLTLHDCWFFTGKCCHYVYVGCDRWRRGCGCCPLLHQYNNSWFFDKTPQMWQNKKEFFSSIPRLAVVGVSDWITNEARQSLLSEASIICRIYNWVDLDFFCPGDSTALRRRLHLENAKIILCVASGWSEHKGLSNVLRIARQLDSHCRILLVGDLKKTQELPSNVMHISMLSPNELVEYYRMADVFVQFSRVETFGKVTAEALACGTPVVVFDSTANPEIVGDSCGYIANPNDLEDILSGINGILQKGKGHYAQICRTYAQEHFCMENRIEDYIQLYQELCEGV